MRLKVSTDPEQLGLCPGAGCGWAIFDHDAAGGRTAGGRRGVYHCPSCGRYLQRDQLVQPGQRKRRKDFGHKRGG